MRAATARRIIQHDSIELRGLGRGGFRTDSASEGYFVPFGRIFLCKRYGTETQNDQVGVG